MKKSVFKGKLQKFQLVSNSIDYGPCPNIEDEVEQRLTITANGRVWLSRYRFGTAGDRYELIDKTHFSIPSNDANEILVAVTNYFACENNILISTDAGVWNLALTNEKGKIFKISGNLFEYQETQLDGISDLIRTKLCRNDLLVFDGNPNKIDRIEIKYSRITKIKPKIIPEGATWDYVTWNHKENLTIDRDTETIEHIKELGSGCKITSNYYVQDGVVSFLDDINLEDFFDIEGDPPDVIEDTFETKKYSITVYTKYDGKKVITGTFDKNGLPKIWPQFIDEVFEFIAFYGLGELFDEDIYRKEKRRQTDLVFCNVTFEDVGQTYCYLSDTDSYCVGDLVVVPTGRDNHDSVAKIKSIEYHQIEDAPFPMERIKRIIKKYEK